MVKNASLLTRTHVWTKTALVRAVTTGDIHLNIHRGCENASLPFESFRASQLLPLGAIVLSEHSDLLDEDSFKGIVMFETVDNLGSLFNDLVRLSPDVRSELAIAAASLYAERFDPRRLFGNAGVYALLNAMSKRRERSLQNAKTRGKDSHQRSA
jgi:hypothetical protein